MHLDQSYFAPMHVKHYKIAVSSKEIVFCAIAFTASKIS